MGGVCCGEKTRETRNGLSKTTSVNDIDRVHVVIPPTVVRALYDYSAMQDGDLSFRRGDRMIVIDDSDPDWPLVEHQGGNAEGKIPSNYVVREDDNSMEAQDWWFDVDRREAERLLQLPEAEEGSFLVRPSKDDEDTLGMSVRSFDIAKQKFRCRHYRIRKKENGQVFIKADIVFWTVIDLVDHYIEKPPGQGIMLTKPCPKEPEPVPFKDVEIPSSSISLDSELGSGNFGKVWKGTWNNHVQVAVKTIKGDQMSEDLFLEEAKTMHKLRHKKLVQLIGVCLEESNMCIVTELMENGALKDVLRDDKGERLNMAMVVNMASQVCEGMEYLEEQNYVHRDLRTANILVDKNYVCKVADFGMARLMENEVYVSHMNKFPIRWTAPESIFERTFTVKSDVWSYGILLFEIVSYGMSPYMGMTNNEVKSKVRKGYRMDRPKKCGNYNKECPEFVYQVMLECWAEDPAERPSFKTLNKKMAGFADTLMQIEGPYDDMGSS